MDDYVDYQEYLNSSDWRITKASKLKATGRKCQICRGEESLQVHHLNYDNLYHEKDSDLLVLCEPCHIKETEQPFVVELLQRRKEENARVF